MRLACLCVAALVSAAASKRLRGGAGVHSRDTESQAADFIAKAELELQVITISSTFDEWDYATNINEETKKKKTKSSEEYSKLSKKLGKEAQSFDLNQIQDYDVKRKLNMLKNIGTAALPEDKLSEFLDLTTSMAEMYSTAKVPSRDNRRHQLSLEPEVSEVMARSRDPEELRYYWEQWRRATGERMGDQYRQYIDLYNEAATLNGFSDASQMKVDPYESATFQQEMEATWQGLKPLYEQLHAYVRHKLHRYYGDRVMEATGAMPAHILGNMWAQQWNNIADLVKPYPDKPSIDVTEAMVKQGWTPKVMFEKADDFFQSLGLRRVPAEFWSGSMIERPEDGREVICHASAWDFYNAKDFRIKQCTRVTQEDFITVNHEMGHIQYQMQYSNLSHLYRDGANPGFHEGVADILSLAVDTGTYYQKLGLLSPDLDISDEETNINILFDMALKRVAFLPFAYLVDKYRWDLYSGRVAREDMNCHWWKLRSEIQGLRPPSQRSSAQFDAGSKFHVAADIGYVRYFTAFIYEFQFYRELCLASGKYVPGDPSKPLHQCNFYGSKAAGAKLREMLRLGASRPWKEVMEVMTGEPRMDTAAIREYFRPLEAWLEAENTRHGVRVGWDHEDSGVMCSTESPNTQLWRLFLS